MRKVYNPWLELNQKSRSFFLQGDRQRVEAFNGRLIASTFQLRDDLLPEPYVGDLKAARVIVLMSNPGVALGESDKRCSSAVMEARWKNLRQEAQDYPFYPLNPRLRNAPASEYWLPRLRDLTDEFSSPQDRQQLASRLCVVQWHGYHSKKFRATWELRGTPLCSQSFVFETVVNHLKQAKKPVFVLVMRSSRLWARSIPLERFSRTAELYNHGARCSYISRTNIKKEGFFDRMITALRT